MLPLPRPAPNPDPPDETRQATPAEAHVTPLPAPRQPGKDYDLQPVTVPALDHYLVTDDSDERFHVH